MGIGGGGLGLRLGKADGRRLDRGQSAVQSGAESTGIDHRAIYGLGHSEEVVGRALRGDPAAERPYVFTKGGWSGSIAAVRGAQRNLQPESIRREVEASLRRLGVERIDLYQFHWPDALGTPVEDSWGEMSRA